MPIIGILYVSMFYSLIMPLFGNSLVHCITLGLVFGFINYFIEHIKMITEIMTDELKHASKYNFIYAKNKN